MNRQIGELSRAVSADASATKAMQAKHYVFVIEVPASVGSKAAPILRGVIRAGSVGAGTAATAGGAWSRGADDEVRAGKHAIAKAVIEAEEFIVSKTGIEGHLGNDIRRRVEGVRTCRGARRVKRGTGCTGGSVGTSGATGDRAVVGIAGAGRSEQEIVGVAVGAKSALRIFDGYSEGKFMVEIFGQANPVLASEGKADVVSRVDGLGTGIVGFAQVIAGSDSSNVFGDQTPHLAAENAPSVVEFGL